MQPIFCTEVITQACRQTPADAIAPCSVDAWCSTGCPAEAWRQCPRIKAAVAVYGEKIVAACLSREYLPSDDNQGDFS
jgi:hypothetical protein